MPLPTTAEDCQACAARGALTFDADTQSAPAKGSPLLFEFHQGERVACPDCGRLYLRTLTNGDVPFMHRDVHEYSYQKLPERLAPTPRPPTPKPSPAPPAPEATELVRVLRCPRCRSTRVSRSTWEVSDEHDVRLTCEACHYVQTVDADDCTGWKVFLELPTGHRTLPEFVPLDAELPAAPLEVPTPVVEAPRPAPAVVQAPALPPPGCARCVGATAAAAWTAISGPPTHTFVHEPHFSVHATRCSCGQPFVVVFTERVDFRDGSDTQVELAVAIWPAELEAMGGDFRPLALTTLVRGRAFLVKSPGDAPRWLASGFAIGPHD